jgi:hypothetical protein
MAHTLKKTMLECQLRDPSTGTLCPHLGSILIIMKDGVMNEWRVLKEAWVVERIWLLV